MTTSYVYFVLFSLLIVSCINFGVFKDQRIVLEEDDDDQAPSRASIAAQALIGQSNDAAKTAKDDIEKSQKDLLDAKQDSIKLKKILQSERTARSAARTEEAAAFDMNAKVQSQLTAASADEELQKKYSAAAKEAMRAAKAAAVAAVREDSRVRVLTDAAKAGRRQAM
eukprot:CAMPEP_0113692036 /NCGR_PEP_ID=MMETSP0038_2-20120614/18840_1 /TAXON_ID=2898 /ORGANISM="Cryptomonas paramecium" /LENGTH=167 /DNA_ID=CAMNT_0000613861 /DNA_START=46 /DNA_END=546 /DNA_ORIENTATION=+ /assembly_acc=CAM_ASM_000170